MTMNISEYTICFGNENPAHVPKIQVFIGHHWLQLA